MNRAQTWGRFRSQIHSSEQFKAVARPGTPKRFCALCEKSGLCDLSSPLASIAGNPVSCRPVKKAAGGQYPLRMAQRVRIVDSHTEGEPTRVVVSGAPDLGSGPLNERAKRLRAEFDW